MKISYADALTISRLFITPIIIFTILKNYYYLSAFLVVFTIFTDWLDGILARKFHDVTSHGKLLDPAVDKIFTISVLTAFVEKHLISSFAVFLIVAREFLITWFRSVMVNKGIVVPASNLGKIKTTLQLAAIFILSLNYSFIGNIVLWFSILVAYVSAVDYLKLFFKEKVWN
ncbi:MAG: CDP-diacylglycerol--glycerol-3-phosphate 3-phosphatidyltransferase [Aquificota bacterium]|nr:MAG: CDP-diacylglycerol--glycerol-3-phosphate 3-phosphatidyltransferase [Aquificota bacterium]